MLGNNCIPASSVRWTFSSLAGPSPLSFCTLIFIVYFVHIFSEPIVVVVFETFPTSFVCSGSRSDSYRILYAMNGPLIPLAGRWRKKTKRKRKPRERISAAPRDYISRTHGPHPNWSQFWVTKIQWILNYSERDECECPPPHPDKRSRLAPLYQELTAYQSVVHGNRSDGSQQLLGREEVICTIATYSSDEIDSSRSASGEPVLFATSCYSTNTTCDADPPGSASSQAFFPNLALCTAH